MKMREFEFGTYFNAKFQRPGSEANAKQMQHKCDAKKGEFGF